MGLVTIILGRVYDNNKIFGTGTMFGEYVQIHERTDNTMRDKTVGALAPRASGNIQSSFYSYSLTTGRKLYRRKCTPVPMPKKVTERVHEILDKQNANEGLKFLRMNCAEFEYLVDATAL